MDESFHINVADFIPVLLPRPNQKSRFFEDGVEIPIITVTCEGVEW